MYECKCGRSFENKQSYSAHCGHCKINLGRDPIDRFGQSRSIKTSARLSSFNKFIEAGKLATKLRMNDPEFKLKMKSINSETMLKLFNRFDFIYSKYISSNKKHHSDSDKCLVYLVEFDDLIKVGFTTNLNKRLKKLGNPKVIEVIDFDNIKSGLQFEFEFHKIHKNLMIRNEYYPKSYLTIFKSQFITYKQFN